MWKKLKSWIKAHKLPSVFIFGTILVAVVFGIYAGLSYLVFEDYHLAPAREGLRERARTEAVVYHHTGVSDRPITDHHRFHLTRGWLMVGYHFHIRTDGTIEVGRPHSVVGAHAGATANGWTVGVAFSGNMDQHPPTQEQYDAAIELHYWLESDEGAGYGELDAYGHNEFMATCCPGKFVDLNIIREGVAKLRAEADKDEPARKQIEVELLEGWVRDRPTSGYLVIEEGRVYVPLRWVAEELGYDVTWDGEKRVWGVK